MIDKGLKPDIVVHDTLPGGLLKGKKRSEAIKLSELMKAKGLSPNVRSYIILIRKKDGKVYGVLKEMKEKGCPFDGRNYNALIKLLTNQQDDVFGRKCVERGVALMIILVLFSLEDLRGRENRKRSGKYTQEMIEEGTKAPKLHNNKFASDFSGAGKPDILKELAQKMKISGKFGVSNVFARWFEMMNKRVGRRF
ncbi:hypothetical protein HHK36_023007 [Tetracentron sinense]|uniref:Pentatricopeptide repeat-containing protein n=1 Tax=Tetracentron sinense TaxID=13715 RepID=A0A835D6K8_TETSI|nr:hypothetical protein HHK36_023007 [Tetracentron sinense]